jgi:hypothetical protein
VTGGQTARQVNSKPKPKTKAKAKAKPKAKATLRARVHLRQNSFVPHRF